MANTYLFLYIFWITALCSILVSLWTYLWWIDFRTTFFEPHCISNRFNKQPVLYSSMPLEIMSLKILPSSFLWMSGIYSGICNWICYQSPQHTPVVVTVVLLCPTIHVSIGYSLALSMLTCCCYWYRFELSTKEWSGHPWKLSWASNRLSYIYSNLGMDQASHLWK